QGTILREWIGPRFQETNLAGQPEFRRGMLTGGDLIVSARFAENVVGIPRQGLRMLIISGSFAALIDSSANNMATWQRALPAFNAFSSTLRVEKAAADPEAPAVSRGISGLYMGSKSKYMVDLNRPVG